MLASYSFVTKFKWRMALQRENCSLICLGQWKNPWFIFPIDSFKFVMRVQLTSIEPRDQIPPLLCMLSVRG